MPVDTGGHLGVDDPLEPFGGQAWPRGSGEGSPSQEDRQDQAYAPVTIVQGPPEGSEEPFFPPEGTGAPFRQQGFVGSGANRRFVTAAEIIGGSAYGTPGSAWNDKDE